jgi:hypothetical protein
LDTLPPDTNVDCNLLKRGEEKKYLRPIGKFFFLFSTKPTFFTFQFKLPTNKLISKWFVEPREFCCLLLSFHWHQPDPKATSQTRMRSPPQPLPPQQPFLNAERWAEHFI